MEMTNTQTYDHVGSKGQIRQSFPNEKTTRERSFPKSFGK